MTYLICRHSARCWGLLLAPARQCLLERGEKRSTWSLLKGRPQDCFITALYMPPRLRLPLRDSAHMDG